MPITVQDKILVNLAHKNEFRRRSSQISVVQRELN